jgi:hypothetical protein
MIFFVHGHPLSFVRKLNPVYEFLCLCAKGSLAKDDQYDFIKNQSRSAIIISY